MSEKTLRIVIDVDDVISTHSNRDYKNATPHVDVIRKINYLHEALNYHVTLYTSRGMISCNGDIEMIEKNNREILENWLKKNNVKYDSLLFGKPIADMYVDDKCMNVKEFMEEDFYELKGGSGKKVIRIGNLVKKYASYDKIANTVRWNEDVKGFFNTPKVTSTLYESMYMEHIKGYTVSELVNDKKITNAEINKIFWKIVCAIEDFKRYKLYNDFNLDKHIQIVEKNVGTPEIEARVKKCIAKLKEYETILKRNATFCHGDMTLSNLIIDDKGKLYFIDPEQDVEASSYLLDLAKLRMSLSGYEYRFGLSKNKPDTKLINWYDKELKRQGIYDISIVLQYMYIIRLWRYKSDEDKKIVLEMLKEMEAQHEDILS